MKDSTAETKTHIARVRELISVFTQDMTRRAFVHDESKLESPEKEMFDEVTGRLRGLTYGSDEYKAALADLKPALDHHYAHNSHHPEHYGENGVYGMTLMDVVEMFCDWKAATERHADGSLERSIVHNQTRFHMSDQLAQIFENTRRSLKW